MGLFIRKPFEALQALSLIHIFIKAILPDIEIKTGEISTYHNKGMHTTTFSEMFPVPGNGYIDVYKRQALPTLAKP